MPAEIIQLSNRVLFDGSGAAPALNFPAPTTVGSSVLLIATSLNSANAGANITSVTDSASQTYVQLARVNSASQTMQLSAHLGYGLPASVQTLSVSRVATDTKVSMIALEIKDLTSASAVAIDTKVGAAGSTQLDLMTAATTDPHAFVIGAIGWHWTNSPKNAAVPTRYLLVDQRTSPTDSTLAYQIVQRQSSTTRAKNISWSYAAQANGSLGLLLALKSQPAVRRVRVPISAKVVGATNVKYEVYAEATGTSDPLGAYVVTGTLPTVPTEVYNDLIDLTIPIDDSNTILEDGDTAAVLLEATVGGQTWTNSISRGYTYVQSTATTGTGAARITTNSGNPLTININSGTYAVAKLDAAGAPTVVWSVSDTENFVINQTGQLSLIAPASVSRTVTVTATNSLGSSSIIVTANVATAAVQWGLTISGNTIRKSSDDSVMRLRGMNLFGVIPSSVATAYNTETNMDQLSAYLASATFLTSLKNAFGPWFNCIRVPVSPLTFNAAYSAQRTRFTTLLSSAAALGIYVLAVPYGAGFGSDIISRNNSDGAQDQSNADAITTEVMAVHTNLASLSSLNENLLIGLLHAPRAQTTATWRTQSIAWINNLRSKNYTQPIIIDAPNEGYDLINATDVAAIRAADNKVVFTHQMFRDSGTPGEVNPANTSIPPLWATQRSASNVASGISAIGRSTVGADLGTGDAAWVTNYINLWGDATPIILGWTTLYDYNSVFGSVTGGSMNWLSVVTGAQPPTMNSYGQSLAAALNPA